MSEVKPGFYRHHGGALYRVARENANVILGYGEVEVPGQSFVVCEEQFTTGSHGSYHTWVWPAKNFLEQIRVNGRQVPRHTLVPMPDLPTSDLSKVPDIEIIHRDEVSSVAFEVLAGDGAEKINHRSETEYEVLKGAGSILVDELVIPVEVGSIVTIPVGSAYQTDGLMVVAATHMPPYDHLTVETIA